MPVKLPPKSRPLLRSYVRKPWTLAARRSPGLRKWCEDHGYITPNFSWKEMAGSDGTPVPKNLRKNAIRHCRRLEVFRHRIGDVSISIDGPYRTPARNRAVGGASQSRHMSADATDHYLAQVNRWIRQSPKLKNREDVVRLAKKTFVAVGNETSGTLHVDSRPGKIGSVIFTKW